ARDIMRNFGKLGSRTTWTHDDPSVSNAPRLIVQLDSLMHIFTRSDDVLNGDGFNLRYNMIIIGRVRKPPCPFGFADYVREGDRNLELL
ncbi:MAG: hypothetical protein ACKPKO_63690, partial [Candidatus Fonsibacter sp.]